MNFTYTAKSVGGERTSGVVNAEAEHHARQQLRDEGLFVVSLKPQTSPFAASRANRRRSKVSRREILALTTQLAIMTRAGIDPASALGSLADQTRNTALRKALQGVHRDVTGGKSFSEALRGHTRIFGDVYVSTVAAGEAAGRLPEILDRLAQLQRSDIHRRNTVRTLLAYPLLLATVSSLVVAGLVFLVLPEFARVFDEVDIPLPALTRLLLGVSSGMMAYCWLWGPLLGGLLAAFPFLRRSELGRQAWDNALLNVVCVKAVTQSLLTGRTFRMLGTLIDSGVPILDGVRLTRNAVNNIKYRRMLATMEEDLLNGREMSHSLQSFDFLPPAAADMVRTAERTGTLGMVTRMVGDHYEEEGEARLRELATILEPLIVVIMGMVVGLVVLAVMLPMFDMATFAQ